MPDSDRSLRDVQREQRDKLEQQGRDIDTNRNSMVSFREIVELKFHNLTEDLARIENIIKWAGSLIIGIMLSFMGWALLQQYQANENSKSGLQEQITLMKHEQEQRQEMLQNQREMKESLSPTGTAQSTRRSDSD